MDLLKLVGTFTGLAPSVNKALLYKTLFTIRELDPSSHLQLSSEAGQLHGCSSLACAVSALILGQVKQ